MDIIGFLVDAAQMIPASFWGIVVGSGFTIYGVRQTNQANANRLQAQFEHEQNAKRTEREMALRKDVYLEAAGAVASGMQSLLRFGNLELADIDITGEYVQRAPALAKVHVIATAQTTQQLLNLTNGLSAAYLKLLGGRLALKTIKQQIDSLQRQITQFGDERDRFLELMKQYNINLTRDAERWRVLQGNFDFEAKRVNDALVAQSELVGRLQPMHLEFIAECTRTWGDVMLLLPPLLDSLRKELGLPFDQDAYRLAYEEATAKQIDGLQQFLADLAPKEPRPAPDGRGP